MINFIRDFLHLNPKIRPDEPLIINIGVENNKIVISLDKKVSVIILTKEQLARFLSALAGQAGALK